MRQGWVGWGRESGAVAAVAVAVGVGACSSADAQESGMVCTKESKDDRAGNDDTSMYLCSLRRF